MSANLALHFGTTVETWGTGLATRALAEIIDRPVLAGMTVARLRVFEDNHLGNAIIAGQKAFSRSVR